MYQKEEVFNVKASIHRSILGGPESCIHKSIRKFFIQNQLEQSSVLTMVYLKIQLLSLLEFVTHYSLPGFLFLVFMITLKRGFFFLWAIDHRFIVRQANF